MTPSRATAAAISHAGTRRSTASTMNTVASSSLSAARSRMPPSVVCHPNRLARKPSAASDAAAAKNSPRVVTRSPRSRASAIGITRRILSEVMMFGIWRSHGRTVLMTQFEALNPVLPDAPRLQAAAQGERILQRPGAAPGRQPESDHGAAQTLHAHVRDERERFEIALHVGIILQIVHAADLDDHGRRGAADGE